MWIPKGAALILGPALIRGNTVCVFRSLIVRLMKLIAEYILSDCSVPMKIINILLNFYNNNFSGPFSDTASTYWLLRTISYIILRPSLLLS